MRLQPWTLVLLSLAPLCAMEKPCVTISFRVAETRYRSSLGPVGVANLEHQVTARLLARITEDVRFLKPQTESGCDYVLGFQLNRKDPNQEGAIQAIAMHAILSGPGVTDHLGQNHDFWIVRDDSLADQPVGDVFGAIEATLPPDLAVSLEKLLSQIPISDSGNFVQFNTSGNFKLRGLVMPYEPNELCMPPETDLLVSNQIPSPASTQPLNFEFHAKPGGRFAPPAGHPLANLQGHIFCLAEPINQDFSLVDAFGVDNVTVKSVHVNKYHSAKTLCGRSTSIPPADSGFTGGNP
jgi:hypothetical protein